jgi:hypothetical protein
MLTAGGPTKAAQARASPHHARRGAPQRDHATSENTGGNESHLRRVAIASAVSLCWTTVKLASARVADMDRESPPCAQRTAARERMLSRASRRSLD